jgi:hypothetical protein
MMSHPLAVALTMLALLAGAGPDAQTRRAASIRVTEASGCGGPVSGSRVVPQRTVADAGHAELR